MKHIKRVAKKVTKKAAKKKVEPKQQADAGVTPEPEKIMDVAKPGETIADASSKPIIATKGAPVQDPMVTPLQPAEKSSSGDLMTAAPVEKPELHATKNRIEPLHEVAAADENGVVESPEERSAQSDSADSSDDSGNESSDSASDMSLQGQQQNAKSAEEQAAERRQEQANALIDSKAYFVPINSVKKRRSMRVILLVVTIILVVLVGGLLALDAGVIDIGISPPTDFISE